MDIEERTRITLCRFHKGVGITCEECSEKATRAFCANHLEARDQQLYQNAFDSAFNDHNCNDGCEHDDEISFDPCHVEGCLSTPGYKYCASHAADAVADIYALNPALIPQDIITLLETEVRKRVQAALVQYNIWIVPEEIEGVNVSGFSEEAKAPRQA